MPSRRFAAKLLAALSLALGAAWTAPGCSVVIDGEVDTCETDAECVNFPNSVCEEGTCVSVDKCQSNADCSDATTICRTVSPRTCVPVLGAGCTALHPEDPAIWRSDDTILIAVSNPITEGGEPSDTGVSVTNAAIVAVDEINDAGGVTGGPNGARNLALVICDDEGSTDVAVQNGAHLAGAGIQACIGPAYSGITKAVAEQEAIPAGMLLISTSATSPDLTGVEDRDPGCVSACGGDDACEAQCPTLLWRTSPSDLLQGAAIVAYFEELETLARARVEPPITDDIKVQVLHKSDAYGEGLTDALVNSLEFNGAKANQQPTLFRTLEYGNPDDGEAVDAAAVQAAISFEPDIVIIIGTSEVGGIMQTIEEGWTGGAGTEPYYVFADGGLVTSVADAARATGARTRVRGTIPGSAGPIFDRFAFEYNDTFPEGTDDPSVFGAAGAYDAVYLLAFAARSAGTRPLTGAEFGRGLAKQVSGDVVEPGRSGFGPGQQTIVEDGTIDFEGASGPLDFDVVTGEAPSNIQIWCVPSGAGTQGTVSGRFYDAGTSAMSGTEAAFCSVP